MTTIVVPLDGTGAAERALPYAATLARAGAARLVLVRAASIPAAGAAAAELAAAADRLRTEGHRVDVRVARGAAEAAILDAARLERADLIVMATRGRGRLARWLGGSVAERVLLGAEAPVLVVPPSADAGWTARASARVLVSLDGSELAEEAIGPAIAVAEAFGAGLVLVRVVAPLDDGHLFGASPTRVPSAYVKRALNPALEYVEAIARTLRAAGHSATARAEIGPPAPTIARIAREIGAHAITIAARAPGPLARLFIGSTATDLLQHTDTPVLVVRPPAPPRSVPTIEAHAGASPDRLGNVVRDGRTVVGAALVPLPTPARRPPGRL